LIKPSKPIVIGGAAAAATAAAALAFGRRGSSGRRLGVGAGLLGLGVAAAAWWRADREDQEITRNPEVMNGHFITAGEASAVTGGLADVERLRPLMLLPAEARAMARRRRDHHHGHHRR
jgi:hypothetical protein